jgi:hypothetical protein
MQDKISAEIIQNLNDLGNVVPENYSYSKKNIAPGLLLSVPGACFKWYNLFPPGTEITQEHVEESREFIKSEAIAGRLKIESELGFVILHMAGDYLLLLLTTWRNINEMWQSIYLKKADLPENYTPLIFNNNHKGTYCVWELGVVWHERNAWVDFINSKRDHGAKLTYLNDVFSGSV